ncbi:MAG: YcxB family protein [Clostridia bacterium]|nr:YcxB family protein [Clostridia bacterium]
MTERAFVFKLSPYDNQTLLPQAARALKMRTQLVSREKMPGLWKITDKLNPEGKEPVSNPLRTRILSIICLLLGIFLFVPGLMKPNELIVPLFAGALAIGSGIGGLIRAGRSKNDPYINSAGILLKDKDTAFSDEDIRVSFDDSGMTLPTQDGSETVPYDGFERIMECEDMFLFIYDTRVTVLQKKDLLDADANDLADFLSAKVKNYHRA